MTVVVLSSLTSLLSPNYKFFKPIHSTFNFNYFSNIHLHHPPRFMSYPDRHCLEFASRLILFIVAIPYFKEISSLPGGMALVDAHALTLSSSLSFRLCGHTRRDQDKYTGEYEMGFDEEEKGLQIPTQAQSVVEGSGAVLVSEFKPVPDIDYLQATILLQIL
ncbi:hypothetical protein Lal_00036526 [Lupinus albus]|nr:hypothetical protein Lal_00036526 [Lupinus albus]